MSCRRRLMARLARAGPTPEMGRVRHAGATGQLTMRADSGFYTHGVVSVCRKQQRSVSPPSARVPACAISSRPYPRMPGRPSPIGWRAPPMWPTHSLRKQALCRAGAALVRRVKPAPGSQLATAITASSLLKLRSGAEPSPLALRRIFWPQPDADGAHAGEQIVTTKTLRPGSLAGALPARPAASTLHLPRRSSLGSPVQQRTGSIALLPLPS